MTRPRAHLGDSHNFGRRVTRHEGRVLKPRTIFWERLVLSAQSPLRRALDEAAEQDGLGREAFAFLPDLAFEPRDPIRRGGEVQALLLEPLAELSHDARRGLARIAGRALALFGWLGVADLHWENLALGADDRGRTVFAPLDVEMILADLSLPTETKLLPDADPEYAALSRHACGARRLLPWLGKPIAPGDLVLMAAAYHRTLASLDRHAPALAKALAGEPELREAPIRVCLRATAEYVSERPQDLWPPLLDEEKEQLARGDVPYFFRLYGRPGSHYDADESLARIATLPLEGDVPQLDPLLSLSRDLRSPSRATLREQGLFAVLGAFDHASFRGKHKEDGVEVAFGKRNLVVQLPNGDELEARRDLRVFVGSVYLPCGCGEVRSVFVPPVTRCETALVGASARKKS